MLRRLPPHWRDVLERVAWTAIQAGAGALIDQTTSGHVGWRAVGYAVLLAAAKCVAGLRVGKKGTASIP